MQTGGTRIVQVRGTARPTSRLKARLRQMYGDRRETQVQAVLGDVVMVDALADLMRESVERSQTSDGRIDWHGAAAIVLRRMLENQR